jgi:hypothetical protein
LVLSTSFTEPDDRYSITFQALPWAEFTFRYSINRAIPDFGRALHDRSFDVKFRLSKETENIPELALGFQDVLGTGVYSGEYLAGSKQWGPFDLTLGLGWGRLGTRGTFENPLGLISNRLLHRAGPSGFGGIPLFRSYFRGPDLGLFGGIEYKTPLRGLVLKIEYSSDGYREETRDTNRDFDFPINVGISYRPWAWLDVGLSLMHGRFAGLRITALMDSTAENWQARLNPPPRFSSRGEDVTTILQRGAPASPAGNISAPETHYVDLTAQGAQTLEANIPTISSREPEPFVADTPPTARLVSPDGQPQPGEARQPAGLNAATLDRIKVGLSVQKVNFLGAGLEGRKLVILIENATYRRDTEAIGRTARILSAASPTEIDYFEITLTRVGQPISTVTLLRSEIDKLAQRTGSPAELFYTSELSPGSEESLNYMQTDLFPQIGGFIYPVFRQSLFDPDNPVYVEFGVGASGGMRLARSWFLEGTFIASLYDDFNQINRGANSDLPHVRSDIAQYLKKGKYGVENLSTSYYFKLAPDIYGRATAGYLERMFAGFGGELLYRPFGRRWAVGVDLWSVRQRGYDVLLDLRKHDAITGHLTAYYDLPWHDVQVAVSAGQYLAGDKGVTFQFSRRFSTGIQVGAWFTLSNVSAQRFGEGSFDKGIRIIIPFEWAAPFATQSGYDLGLRPIQRDGGQRLDGDTVLYGMTDPSNYGALSREWSSVFQ